MPVLAPTRDQPFYTVIPTPPHLVAFYDHAGDTEVHILDLTPPGPHGGELFKFLRNYRATQHSTTSVPPAEALFGRNIKTKLPEVRPKVIGSSHKDIIERDDMQESAMKEVADQHNHAQECDIKEHDIVLVQQPRSNKLTTPFNPNPYRVTDRKGSMITAENDAGRVTGNSSFFKKVEGMRELPNIEPNEEEEEPVVPSSGSENKQTSVSSPIYNDSVKTTSNRPVRERRRPTYLKDYVQ